MMEGWSALSSVSLLGSRPGPAHRRPRRCFLSAQQENMPKIAPPLPDLAPVSHDSQTPFPTQQPPALTFQLDPLNISLPEAMHSPRFCRLRGRPHPQTWLNLLSA